MSLTALTNSERNPELANGSYGIFANMVCCSVVLMSSAHKDIPDDYPRAGLSFFYNLADV